jgi:hypothetical protein
MPEESVQLEEDFGEFVKINGLCYQRDTQSQLPPTVLGPPEEVGFVSCIDCSNELTQSSSSSESSSSVALMLSSSSQDDMLVADFNGINHYFQIVDNESSSSSLAYESFSSESSSSTALESSSSTVAMSSSSTESISSSSSSQYPDRMQLPVDMEWSFSFWLIREGDTTDLSSSSSSSSNSSNLPLEQSIISKFNEITSQQEYSIRLVNDKIEVIVKDNASMDLVNHTSTDSIPINEQTHVVITSDSNDVKIYINNSFDSGDFHNGDPRQSVSQFTIGTNSKTVPDEFFKGSIFFISMWNRTLNTTDIAELYNNNVPWPCYCYSASLYSEIVSCWHLMGGSYADSIGNNVLTRFNTVPFIRLVDIGTCQESSSSSSSVVVGFAAAAEGDGSIGDVHWVFGDDLLNNGAAMASFNVDDNSSTNEIVWLTFTEGTTDYTVKYTQQEFDFTAGGKSISNLTISITGQADIVYSLSPDQSHVRKNGLTLIGEDEMTLGSNVINLTVSGVSLNNDNGCANDGEDYFSYIIFDTHFQNGMYYTDKIGGAYYYIWKTAKDEVAATINNPSSAGLDGIGTYLATGGTGYTARSAFETGVIASLDDIRETTDINVISDIATKFNSLIATNGTVDFNWDPLVSGVEPDCPDVDDTWFSVSTSGLNQWAAVEPLFDAGEFLENPLPTKCEFGYNFGPNLTTCYTGWHRIPPGTTSVNVDYRWYKFSGADSATFLFVISNTKPIFGEDLKSMTDTGISLVPNSSDFTTIHNLDLTSALSFVNTNLNMYIAVIVSHYYNGDNPSSWPDAASNGGGTWVEPVTYYES